MSGLADLHATAQKATPGPWEAVSVDGYIGVLQDEADLATHPENDPGTEICEVMGEYADAEFIAAAHPGVMVVLCEAIQAAEEYQDARLALADTSTHATVALARRDNAYARFRAALVRVREELG